MKIGVLSSSRADYGIYSRLLQLMKADGYFQITLIAFGTHLSKDHGHTIDAIRADGFYHHLHEVPAVPSGDSPYDVSMTMSRTLSAFAGYWSENRFELVLCLGDRYEMFAACAAGVPFNLPLAHYSGGEQTLGAIDDALRHCLTHMARYHFTTAAQYQDRVTAMKGSAEHVYNTGALNLDTIKNTRLLTKKEFFERFNINLEISTILITFHPETISFEKNEVYVKELIAAMAEMQGYQLVITMPNADTMGNMIREHLSAFIKGSPNAIGVESFGALGYLSCMQHCSFMLGNTSSGFVEASYFRKYVINLGNRQEGRIITPNIRNCAIKKDDILDAVAAFRTYTGDQPVDVYGSGNASEQIIHILKHLN